MKHLIALCAFAAFFFFSCKAAKHSKGKKSNLTETEQRIPFKTDTTAARLELAPDKGYTMVIENVQIYVITKTQPATGFTIKKANGEQLHHLLPEYSNPESYSYGGGVHFELNPGDKGVVDIFDNNSRPLPSKIIIMGYQKKN